MQIYFALKQSLGKLRKSIKGFRQSQHIKTGNKIKDC